MEPKPPKSVRMIKRNMHWILRKINKLIQNAAEGDESLLARVGEFFCFLPFSFFIKFLLTELIFFLHF